MLDQSVPRQLLLTCRMSMGDIVMLSAAVRDLHRAYPGGFSTNLRTTCPEIWEGNPYRSSVNHSASDVTTIDCHYPLIHRANEDGRHCLHGFIEFLNDYLSLEISLTEPRGEVLLRSEEKQWLPQVAEWTGQQPIPYWIVSAGGKFDLTTKWWGTERYQSVIDYFRGRIQFVQIGHEQHWHPPLKGVIDLRGRTSLRQLIRLVYHAQGILCPVTGLMHLAAAVERPFGQGASVRPCVVVAGGREPVHWERYPGHRFLDTIGELDCCRETGCWKARTRPLGDLDARDLEDRLCVDVQEGDPRCMSLVTPERVVTAIESYFEEGQIVGLTRSQTEAACRGIEQSRNPLFDRWPLTLPMARLTVERQLADTARIAVDECPPRGVVICAGGPYYCFNAWLAIHHLREFNKSIPIEFWAFREEQVEQGYRRGLEALGVRFRFAEEIRGRVPVRALPNAQALKVFAALHAEFQEVMVLDADCVANLNPVQLFESPEYREKGSLFWALESDCVQSETISRCLQVKLESCSSLELGVYLLNRQRCGRGLRLTSWLFEQYDFFYSHLDYSAVFQTAFALAGESLGAVVGGCDLGEAKLQRLRMNSDVFFVHRCLERRLPSESFPCDESEKGWQREFIETWKGSLRPWVEEAFNMSRRFPKGGNRLFHAVWEGNSDDPRARSRKRLATSVWEAQYQLANWVRFGIRLEDLQRVARERHSRWPLWRDMIAMVVAEVSDGDVIVLSPPEVLPAPWLTEKLLTSVRDTGCCYSYGREIAHLRRAATAEQIRKGKPCHDSFLVAFTKDWWEDNGEQIPDTLVKWIGIDERFSQFLERHQEIRCDADLVYHESRA